MNLIPFKRKPEDTPSATTLEAALLDLSRYGLPWVWRSGSGWISKIEMNTTASGAKFEIWSESRHRTPLDAVKQCADRVTAAMRENKGA